MNPGHHQKAVILLEAGVPFAPEIRLVLNNANPDSKGTACLIFALILKQFQKTLHLSALL